MWDYKNHRRTTIDQTHGRGRDSLHMGLGRLRLYAVLVVAWALASMLLGFVSGTLQSIAFAEWLSLGSRVIGLGFMILFAWGVLDCLRFLDAAGDRLRLAFLLVMSLKFCGYAIWLIDHGVGMAGASFLDPQSAGIMVIGIGVRGAPFGLIVILAITAFRLNARFNRALIQRWKLGLFVAFCFMAEAANLGKDFLPIATPSPVSSQWYLAIGLFQLLIDLVLHMRAVAWLGRAQRRLIMKSRCFACGYDLAGNQSGACPECGTATEEWLSRGWRPGVAQPI